MADSPDTEPTRDLREAQQAKVRLNHLQSVAIALSEAMTPDDVADVLITEGMAAFGARIGLISVTTSNGNTTEIIRTSGVPSDALSAWHAISLDSETFLTKAIRTAQLQISNREDDYCARDPLLCEINALSGAEIFAAVPLVAHGTAIGVFLVGYAEHQTFSAEEQTFIVSVARQGALSLERTRLYVDQRNAQIEDETSRWNLAFLAEANRILASSLDYETTLTTLTKLIVPELADWCSIDMQDADGTIHRLAVAHIDPAKIAWAHELHRRYPANPNAGSGMYKVLKTGESDFYPDIPDELLVKSIQDPEHLALIREIGMISVMIVPLVARDHTLGVITLVTTSESGRHFTTDSLAFAEDLARRAAVAVDNARLYQAAQEALYEREASVYLHQSAEIRLTLLAEASGKLAGTLKTGDVLPEIMELTRRLIAADAYAIWRGFSETNQWKLVTQEGLSEAFQGEITPESPQNVRIPERPLVVGEVSREPFLASRLETYQREGIRAVLILPLTIHDKRSGTLALYYHQPRIFDETEVRVAMALANLAASAISTAELYEEQTNLRREAQEAAQAQRAFLRDVLASVTDNRLRLCSAEDELPSPREEHRGWTRLTPHDLVTIRRNVQQVTIEQDYPQIRTVDLITAVGEAAMNAVVHAGGGRARVCATPEAGVVQVWIQDRGTGIAVDRLPRATLERGYTTAGTLGHGFKMILSTVDRVWLLTGPSGTTVVIEQDKTSHDDNSWT